MAEQDLIGRIETLLHPTIEAMGFAIVRIQVVGKTRPRLQLMVERSDDATMTVEHCAEVSRAVSAILDVEDPIHGAYTLEVSSPGIDRPLVRLADFDRFAGFDARIEMDRPVDGRRRFTGRLLGTRDQQILLVVEGSELTLPHSEIRRAKLILTEDLLAAGKH